MSLITKTVITDLAGTAPYLLRWSLWLPGGWSLKLHRIVRPDDDRCEHDHPWLMVRVILWGGYIESRNDRPYELKPWRPWAPWRIYVSKTDFRHRILWFRNGRSSWTLALCGPREQAWGFFTREGWVHWERFVKAARSARILWCEDGRGVGGHEP